VKRKRILPAAFLITLCASAGLLFAFWASSYAQSETPAASAPQHSGQPPGFRLLSEQAKAGIPPDQRQLLTLAEDGTLLIDPGSPENARSYYRLIAAKFPSLPDNCRASNLLDCTLTDALDYFGYRPFLPTDLQRLAPETLMDYGLLLRAVSNPEAFRGYPPTSRQELLASRFFAPKIVSVKVLPPSKYGWRKVIWLKARRGSRAERDGMESFYLLFNFESSTPVFPEGADAGQIQTMWTPVYPTSTHFSAYFFVFNALSGRCPEADDSGNVVNKPCTPGQVGLHLTASFDANDLPQMNYFVPNACAQCHGAAGTGERETKINYLDTDHWYDRVQQPDGDFNRVEKKDVLVQGGGRAMKTIHDLNERIRAQNAAVGPTESFQLRAAQKWLELHADCRGPALECRDLHVPVIARGFRRSGSDTVWSAARETDQKLLPLLNQGCFRCHSSFRYHVFEKKYVYDRRTSLQGRIRSGSMPPDRILTPQQREEMIKLLGELTP